MPTGSYPKPEVAREWKNGAKNVRRKIRKMIRRLRGPRRRDRWGEGLGPAAGGFGVGDKGKACAETGDAWEGGCEDSDDEEARSCCSKSLILFCASYNSASLRSSSSLNICLLSCSVSSSSFRFHSPYSPAQNFPPRSSLAPSPTLLALVQCPLLLEPHCPFRTLLGGPRVRSWLGVRGVRRSHSSPH